MAAAKEQAQEPFKSTFVRLGRDTWFTLENSLRADDERASDLEQRLQAVGKQVQSTLKMGIPWMKLGDWEQRRTWTDDEWVAFLRTWKHHGGVVFDDAFLTEQEEKLMNAFTVYWTFYACVPERPEGVPADLTMEMAGQQVDALLEKFHDRLDTSNNAPSCSTCGKAENETTKLKTCSM